MFSDSESDSNSDNEDYDRRDASNVKKLQDFLSTPGIKNDPGDSTTIIVDRVSNGCYNIDKESKNSKKFFSLLSRLDMEKQIMYEKQSETRGGLMIDLDMYFKKSAVVITPKHRKAFCKMVADLMFEFFDVEKIHQAVIIKPLETKDGVRVMTNDKEKKLFKDGFHVLVPDVLMTKEMRKFFLAELNKKLKDLESFSKLKFVGDILDQNSAFVGVHFIGCPSKSGKKAYTLENVFRCTKDGIKDIKRKAVKMHNITLEFTVNEWGNEKMIDKRELAFNEYAMTLFGLHLDVKETKEAKISENEQKYKPSKKQIEEVQDDIIGFLGHISDMVASLPDSMAAEGRAQGRGWHRVLSCVSNIAEAYGLLVEHREEFIDMCDEFSQRGDEAYKNRDDVERCFDMPKKFGYVSYLLYLVRTNSVNAESVIQGFADDFPEHDVQTDQNTAGMDPLELVVYRLLFDKIIAGELNDTTASKALIISFADEIVVSNDEGDGYQFCSESNLWKPRTKSELARLIPEMLGVFVRKVCCKLQQSAGEYYAKAAAGGSLADVAENKNLAKYYSDLLADTKKFLNYISSATGMRNIWAVSKPNLWNTEFERKLNISHDLFPTMDGNVMDMRSGVSRPRTKEDMFSFCCPVEYVPNADLRNVRRFVDSIFCDNQELIEYMRTRMGMFMTGRNVREFDIWYGEGRNGKSSLCRILGDILKSGNFYNTLCNGIFVSNPKLSQTQKSQHTSHLVPLIGIRLGICQEIDANSTLNAALIKSVSAGDPFKCRGAFEKLEAEHVPCCKMVLCVNPIPKSPDDDAALVDRTRYIPFEAKFVDKPNPMNPNEKLADNVFAEQTMTSQSERNNFFSWLVGGSMTFYANNMKLNTPQIVIQAKIDKVAANDVVSEFLGECCNTKDKIAFELLGKADKRDWMLNINELNRKFGEWMETNGEPQPKRGFLAKRLESLGYKKKKSDGSFVYSGLQFTSDADSDAESDDDTE
jgi:P4 family phage/plasmid primase-like protien